MELSSIEKEILRSSLNMKINQWLDNGNWLIHPRSFKRMEDLLKKLGG